MFAYWVIFQPYMTDKSLIQYTNLQYISNESLYLINDRLTSNPYFEHCKVVYKVVATWNCNIFHVITVITVKRLIIENYLCIMSFAKSFQKINQLMIQYNC